MLLAAITQPAHAETLTARVIGITDGDTITVLVEQQGKRPQLPNRRLPESRILNAESCRQARSC